MPIRLDILPRIPAMVDVSERRGLLTFVIDSEYAIVPDRLRGKIEHQEVEGGQVTLKGWMADTDFKLPPVTILATRDRHLIATTNVFEARSDVARVIGASVDEFGFNLAFKMGAPGAFNVALWGVLQNMEVSFFGNVRIDVAPAVKPRLVSENKIAKQA